MSVVLNGGRVPPQNGLKMVSGYKDHHLCLSKVPERLTTTPGHEIENILTGDSKLILEEEHRSVSEIPRMKELLLIHLDFIQQQSEQLTTKENQIADLRRENDMLKLRIDRMERRVALQRNRSSTSGGGTGVENGIAARGGSPSGSEQHQRKKRRRSVDSVTRSKRQDILPGKRNSRLESKRNRKREEGEGSPVKKDNHLTTEASYYTTVGERECMWTCETHNPVKPSTLEVPKWRMKNYSSSYTMEGTENLSEDVFSRRHYRLSIDEKRRKRWDVQRIREQRQNERLRQREKMRQGGEGQEEGETQTFWPRPHPSLVLAVDDTVPVSVFGIPLTSPSISEFSLPWLAGKELSMKTLRSFSKRKR